MKKLTLFSIVLFSALSSFAAKNPQIRACVMVGGVFIVVNAPGDQIGLCKLGPSLVGSIDILNKDARIEVPLSLYNYKKGVQLCSPQNMAVMTTFDGEEISVCQYYDGSIIDIETLANGKYSNRNTQLNKVLGL